MIDSIASTDWSTHYSPEVQSQAMHLLESGTVLYFPHLAFGVLPHEKHFLSPKYAHKNAKNISFNIKTNLLRGIVSTPAEEAALKEMIKRFSQQAQGLIEQLFPSYQAGLQIGRTSFRPVEILGRIPKSYRKDDTRLHVDAFPTSPNQGKRILRVFSNINPQGRDRVWRIGEPFSDVAHRFLPAIPKPWPGRGAVLKALKITKGYSTEYDYTMLQIHNRMKADLAYQKGAAQTEVRFPPGCTWIVQTDDVSHAALSGQHVLEQTFYLPISNMAQPERSPLRILEKIRGRPLV